jgi:predicted metalloprotease with PDZ domain
MTESLRRSLTVCLTVLSLSTPALARSGKPAPRPPSPIKVSYSVAFPQPHTHLFEVTATFENVAGPQLDLLLPTWTPGSYLQREYARHVQDFKAMDESGQALAWDKADKSTWRIATADKDAKPRTVRAFYRVYANELTTQGSHLDATHAYFNGASLFLYAGSARDQPHRVTFTTPPGWRVSSPLALAPDADGYYTAPSYDVLIDSPTEIGTHRVIDFSVRGVPHRIALWGDANPDEARLKEDMAKFVEQAALIFGGLPYQHYTFIVHVEPGIGGGTEHLNSNVSQASPAAFTNPEGYRGFLELESHEYFHCFNVKRIRPLALGPFDYEHENYTHNLWVAEGITDYYGDQLLRRAGLVSAADYLQAWGKLIAGYQNTPGRRLQSAASASFDAWIKQYRPDENSVNTSMSYYTRGQILGWLIDFEIRSRSGGKRGLDDAMRMLYERHGLPKPGFTDAQLKATLEEAAGSDLTDFFAKYVYGTEEVPFDRYWQMAGLQATGTYQPAVDGSQKPGTLGIRTRTTGDRVVIAAVLSGLPAYAGGLNANDELVTIGGRKIDAGNLGDRLNAIREGQGVTVQVFRHERLLSFELTAAPKPFDAYTVAPLKDLSAGQRAIYQAWLHEAPKP